MAPARKKLGELLVEMGTVDPVTIQMALAQQARRGGRLGQVLMDLNKLSEDQLLQALAAQQGVQPVRLKEQKPHPQALALVPRDLAIRFNMLPLAVVREGGRDVLAVGCTEPGNPQMHTLVEQRVGLPLRPYLAHEADLARMLDAHYPDNAAPPPPPSTRSVPAPNFRGPPAGKPASFGAPVAQGHAVPQFDNLPTVVSMAAPRQAFPATFPRAGAPAAASLEELDVDVGDMGKPTTVEMTAPPPVAARGPAPAPRSATPADGVTVDLDDLSIVDEPTNPGEDEEDGFSVEEDTASPAPAAARVNGSVLAGVSPDVRLQVMALIKQALIEDELIWVFIEKGLVTESEVTRLRGSPLPRRGG
jgi:hypothetical protein